VILLLPSDCRKGGLLWLFFLFLPRWKWPAHRVNVLLIVLLFRFAQGVRPLLLPEPISLCVNSSYVVETLQKPWHSCCRQIPPPALFVPLDDNPIISPK